MGYGPMGYGLEAMGCLLWLLAVAVDRGAIVYGRSAMKSHSP